MLFINPMWDHESQRIGKQKCTPLGYRLHVISDLVGFIGLLFLLSAGAYLAYRGLTGTFKLSLLVLIAIPFSLGFVGSALFRYSWMLADRKEFRYDYASSEASWMENGQRHTYKWKADPSDD